MDRGVYCTSFFFNEIVIFPSCLFVSFCFVLYFSWIDRYLRIPYLPTYLPTSKRVFPSLVPRHFFLLFSIGMQQNRARRE